MVFRVLVIGFTVLLAGCGSASGEASVSSSSGRTDQSILTSLESGNKSAVSSERANTSVSTEEYCLALGKVDSAVANFYDSLEDLDDDDDDDFLYEEASEKYAVSLIEASEVAPADHVDGLIAWASAFNPYKPFDNPKLKDTDFWQGLSEKERTDWSMFYEAAFDASAPVWEYGSEECGLKHPLEYETPAEENFVHMDESDTTDTTPKDDTEDTNSFSAVPAS